MAELNLKQIIDRLNTEFTGETRKLVFWYDDKAEFEEDIDSVKLENATVYKLERDNQFYTKYTEASKDEHFKPHAKGVIQGYKYCRNCGHKVPESTKFCDKCGERMDY